MKKIFTAIVLLAMGAGCFCQKITDEKFKIDYRSYPLVKLQDEITDYSSNNTFLRLYDKEKVASGSYSLWGKAYPMKKHQNTWNEKIETVGMNSSEKIIVSQPVEIKMKDRDGKIIYYRIFNTPYQENPASFTTNVDEMRNFMDVSSQLNTLFVERINDISLKLFSVEKSTNHQDVVDAYQICIEGINLFNEGNTIAGKEKFAQAVDAWEKALKEAELKNSKARINKKVADALYKNLIQVLPFVDQHDRALELITEYRNTIGGFGVLFTDAKRIQVEKLALNHLAETTKGANTFADLEGNKKATILMSGDKKVCPGSSSETTNLIAGSWRIVYESYKLPTNIEAERLTRGMNDERAKHQWIHLSPDGTWVFQQGSWETSYKQDFEDTKKPWKIRTTQDGRKILCLAMEASDFDDQSMLTMFEVIHLSKDQLVLYGATYPDHDTTTESVIQLNRVEYL